MTDNKNTFKPKIEYTRVKPQYLTFLLMIYVTLSLAGNAVLFKLIDLGILIGPGGILVVPLILLIEDIIAEVYGYEISRTLLWYILASELLFSLVVIGIIHIHSPSYWHEQLAFNEVFNSLSKGTPILILAVFSGRFLNIFVITKLKILTRGRFFWMRSIFSSLLGDLVTLTILYTLLFHAMSFDVKAQLYFSDLFTRVLYSIFGGGLGVLVVRFLKRKEGLDVYDYNTDFNPFKINIKDK